MARVATSCDTWPVKPRLPEQSRPDIRNNHGNRLCGRKKKAFVRTKKERALILREPALQKPSFPIILFGGRLSPPPRVTQF